MVLGLKTPGCVNLSLNIAISQYFCHSVSSGFRNDETNSLLALLDTMTDHAGEDELENNEVNNMLSIRKI